MPNSGAAAISNLFVIRQNLLVGAVSTIPKKPGLSGGQTKSHLPDMNNYDDTYVNINTSEDQIYLQFSLSHL